MTSTLRPKPWLSALIGFCFIALACSSLSAPPRAAPTSLPSATVPPTSTLTFTPPATFTPVYSPTPEAVPSDFIALCEGAPNKNVTDGTAQIPILILDNVLYEERGWLRRPISSSVRAGSMAEVKTLVCVREDRQKAFSYSDGSAGYRRRLEVFLIETATGSVIASESGVGGDPPSVKFGSGPGYGPAPSIGLLGDLYEQYPDPNAPTTINLTATIISIAISPDGSQLAISSGSGIEIRDLQTGEILGQWEGFANGNGDPLQFSPDGRWLLSSEFGIPDMTTLWEVPSGTIVNTFEGGNSTFSPDGKLIATITQDPDMFLDIAVIWDAASGNRIVSTPADPVTFTPFIQDVAFSPDGKTLAVTGNDSTILIWDWQQEKVVATVGDPGGSLEFGVVSELAFSSDDRTLASAHMNGIINLWDSTTGKLIRTLGPFGGDASDPALINTLTFSPDGKFLAAGLDDETVRVWETTTWLEIHTFYREDFDRLGTVDKVVFTPDSKSLYAGSGTTINIWRIAE